MTRWFEAPAAWIGAAAVLVVVALLRAGVPAGATARLCGIEVADLGDLVAERLGILGEPPPA